MQCEKQDVQCITHHSKYLSKIVNKVSEKLAAQLSGFRLIPLSIIQRGP